MPLFPYDEEEERRRRLGLPPPPPLTASPAAAPSMAPPTGTERPMMPTRPGRGEEIAEARDVYMQKTPGRARSALTGLGLGALQGLAGGGGLSGAARGATAGALTGVISPRTIRRQQFEREVAPQINERFDIEAAETARVRQAEEDALGRQYKTAQIGALNRSNIPAPARPRQPIRSDRGLYDPEAGGIIPGTEPLPRTPEPRLITFEGRTYDYNDPAQRAALGKAQAGVPRDKKGRAISRADERATVRANKPAKPRALRKVATIEDIDAAVAASGLSELEVKKRFVEKGYRIIE